MKPHESWLVKAEHDIGAAKILIFGDSGFSDIGIFHTQQCAEKALKAYLAFLDLPLEKTQDLKRLIGLCSSHDKDFESLIASANLLNPFSEIYRYPRKDMIPDHETALEAVDSAQKIFDFVKGKIS